ncbi:MAG: MBL fold metallo-hydrolase [Planctomycetota bacterium]
MLRIGDYEVISIDDGLFRLDGGAMFGVVPKTLWEKVAPADGKNRIPLGVRPLLIRGRGETVLVDAGLGDKEDAKFDGFFSVERPRKLMTALAAAGVRPADVTRVIFTHLHFDHDGGATRREGMKAVLVFPNARHLVQRIEWEEATHPNRRTRGSYLPENIGPLGESGNLDLLDGDTEILPGLRVHVTGGHCRGHQMVFIEGGGRTAAYWGDLVPTAAHLRVPYVMGYDLFPIEVMEGKEALLPRAAREGWINFWAHDPAIAASLLREENGEVVLGDEVSAVARGS